MRLTQEEYDKLMNRKGEPSSPPPKKSKYRNQKVVIDGITFDSKREGERYRQLKMMEAGGVISQLMLQMVYELAPPVVINGRKKPALRYVADFVYVRDRKIVVEDVKGMITDVYKIKRHLMKSVFNIDVLET